MSAAEYPEIDFKEIKRWLKRGDITSLASAHNLTRKHVSDVLNGRKRNMALVEEASELALKNKSRLVQSQERLRQIDSTLKQIGA